MWSPSSSRFFSTEACKDLDEPKKLLPDISDFSLELRSATLKVNASSEDDSGDTDPKLYDYEGAEKPKKSRNISGTSQLIHLTCTIY